MIISHKHKFIFIKTVKTAGTSLEVFLSQHCGPDDVLTPFAPPSRDTSRVTTKDPLDPSLKSCVSHSGRGLPGAASSLDTSAFTIICRDRKSTRLNSSHRCISYAVFCLKKKNGRRTKSSPTK